LSFWDLILRSSAQVAVPSLEETLSRWWGLPAAGSASGTSGLTEIDAEIVEENEFCAR
jgi:hypothetical protein